MTSLFEGKKCNAFFSFPNSPPYNINNIPNVVPQVGLEVTNLAHENITHPICSSLGSLFSAHLLAQPIKNLVHMYSHIDSCEIMSKYFQKDIFLF